jgi:hypothetical protein
MRRLLVPIAIALTVASISGSAMASTLRVRLDPNDSRSNLDIHKVITNLSDTTMYLRLKSWERFKAREMRVNWAFELDTLGTRDFDREVVIRRGVRGIVCYVWNAHFAHLIGHRDATRPDPKSAACHLPRVWFGHIDRAVRFQAVAVSRRAGLTDKAPDRGVYRWI